MKMKKVIFIAIAIFLTVSTSEAQTQTQAQTQANTHKNKSSIKYSFLWGLIKSKNYKPHKTKANTEERTTKLFIIDTANYEIKRVLWGAVQWTEKKKKIDDKQSTNE